LSHHKCRQVTEQVANLLQQAKLKLATAESCTGGWIACEVTALSGSSQWFERGFVTYTNQSKQDMLGVNAETLRQYGAVSEQTVREMAQGALSNSQADVSVAVSGIAGPGGGSEEKPVGTVWIAWALGSKMKASLFSFDGDREQVREQAVMASLKGILELIKING